MNLPVLRSLFALSFSLCSARASVVINEIFYNAPNEIEDLQFIELHNPGNSDVDVGRWKLARAVDYQFPADVALPADGYLVVAANAERYQEVYGALPAGVFKGRLSGNGERLDLVDQHGKKIDSLKYKDEAPWPTGADGYSASLERICPAADGTSPDNWAASPLPEDEPRPAGTPGQRNANYSPSLPPLISNVKFSPTQPKPDEAVTVTADVRDPEGVRDVTLRYRLVNSGAEQSEATVSMVKSGDRNYAASIPGQKGGQLVRFRVESVNVKGAKRIVPAVGEPRPAISYIVSGQHQAGKLPLAFVINADSAAAKSMARHMRAPHQRGFSEENQLRMFARMQLESGMNLAPLWFELAADEGVRFNQVVPIRSVFTNQVAARDKLIAETLEAEDLKEKMNGIAEMVQSFHTRLKEDAKPSLNEEQNKKLAVMQEKQLAAAREGQRGFTPETLLQRVLNLESTFFKVSTRPDLAAAQFEQVAALYRSALVQRSQLTNAAQALMQGQGDFFELREKALRINEDLDKKLKAVLNPGQHREWARARKESEAFLPGQGKAQAPEPPQGRSAFVFVDPQTGRADVYDFVNVSERNAGLNIHFHKDRLFKEMSTLNVLFEVNDRFVLAEPLAYEFYRRLGNAAPLADYLRLTVDGQPLGYYEYIEQPNRAFLQRNRRNDGGNLYKILWYGSGVVGQHEKKTNRQTGHDDIVELVDLLEKSKDNSDEQWALIKKHFNVEQVINYFAANMCLSHWDGFFNNYFAYHDPGSGKWEMYPWDQDKTWGNYDGLDASQVFFDMPVTMGMEGDVPPGWPKDRPAPRFFGQGGPQWWRPGGYFSKPLLANAHFRKHFLARTKDILNTVYTEQVFFPIIDAFAERLRAEVGLRAELSKEKPQEALARLEQNVQSLKEHLVKRRQFLLEQDEIRAAGKFARAELK